MSVLAVTPTLAGSAFSIAWRPQGDLIAVTHDNSPFLSVVRTSDGEIDPGWPTLPGAGKGCAWSPDGTQLFVSNTTAPNVGIIDFATKTLDNTGWITFPAPFTINRAAWSPDGSLIAVTHGRGTAATRTFTVLSPVTKQLVGGFPTSGPGTQSKTAVWSPDGQRLAVLFADANGLRVINANTAEYESGWPSDVGGSLSPGGLAWSPDSGRLAVPSAGAVIDADTKTYESGWPSLAGAAGLAWSPDGTRLARPLFTAGGVQVINTQTQTVETGWLSAGGTTRAVAFAWDPGNSLSG